MINMSQARALVDSAEYRDWEIKNPESMGLGIFDLMRVAAVEGQGRVPVVIVYEAPNSDEGARGDVRNVVAFSIPLTDTEAEFARALFEAIRVIEDHEAREFFRIGYGEIDHRPIEKGSRAIFHPHGFNRNKMFHDLDPFAKEVKMTTIAHGGPLTADAV